MDKETIEIAVSAIDDQIKRASREMVEISEKIVILEKSRSAILKLVGDKPIKKPPKEKEDQTVPNTRSIESIKIGSVNIRTDAIKLIKGLFTNPERIMTHTEVRNILMDTFGWTEGTAKVNTSTALNYLVRTGDVEKISKGIKNPRFKKANVHTILKTATKPKPQEDTRTIKILEKTYSLQVIEFVFSLLRGEWRDIPALSKAVAGKFEYTSSTTAYYVNGALQHYKDKIEVKEIFEPHYQKLMRIQTVKIETTPEEEKVAFDRMKEVDRQK